MTRTIVAICVVLVILSGCTSPSSDPVEAPVVDDKESGGAPMIRDNESVEPPSQKPVGLANGTTFRYGADNWTYDWQVKGLVERQDGWEYELHGALYDGTQIWDEFWRLDATALNFNRFSSTEGFTFAISCPPGEGGILPLQNRTYQCPGEVLYHHQVEPRFELEIGSTREVSVDGRTYNTTQFILYGTTTDEQHVFMEAAYSPEIGFFTWFDFSWHDQPSMTLVGIDMP